MLIEEVAGGSGGRHEVKTVTSHTLDLQVGAAPLVFTEVLHSTMINTHKVHVVQFPLQHSTRITASQASDQRRILSKKDKASFCTTIRQMLIHQVLPN